MSLCGFELFSCEASAMFRCVFDGCSAAFIGNLKVRRLPHAFLWGHSRCNSWSLWVHFEITVGSICGVVRGRPLQHCLFALLLWGLFAFFFQNSAENVLDPLRGHFGVAYEIMFAILMCMVRTFTGRCVYPGMYMYTCFYMHIFIRRPPACEAIF